MKNFFSRLKLKYVVIVIAIITLASGYFIYKNTNSTTAAITTTASVTKGTLINTISTTGTISSGNTTNVSTKASGTVSNVYVKNGDKVKKGQTLLTLNLDSDGIERRSSAYANYLKAKEDVSTAIKNKQDLVIQVWKDKQAILDAHAAQDNKNLLPDNYTESTKNQIDETVKQTQLAFDVTAAKYEDADSAIAAAKIAQSAAYDDYRDVSGTIVSPADGLINNLTLVTGNTLSATTSQSTSTGSSYASSQVIGFIRSANNEYQAKVSLTESDVVKVNAGQKVNITMDAHSGKSFTGRVLAVDVSGTSSSGVSSYPATIVMDQTDLPIYPNMTVTATIITNIESDVLLIPTTAITTADGKSTILKQVDGKEVTTQIEIGSSNDTDTVVKSGLSEGDVIITGSATSAKNSNTTSAFSNTRQGEMRISGPGQF